MIFSLTKNSLLLTYFVAFSLCANSLSVQASVGSDSPEDREIETSSPTWAPEARTIIGLDFITTLPTEVLMKIMENLDFKSLRAASGTAKILNSITKDEQFQKKFFDLTQTEYNHRVAHNLPTIFSPEISPTIIEFLKGKSLYHYGPALLNLLSEENKTFLTKELKAQLLKNFPVKNDDGIIISDNVERLFLFTSYAYKLFKNMAKKAQSNVIATLARLPKESLADHIAILAEAIYNHRDKLFEDMSGRDKSLVISILAELPKEEELANHIIVFMEAIYNHRKKLFKDVYMNNMHFIISALAKLPKEGLADHIATFAEAIDNHREGLFENIGEFNHHTLIVDLIPLTSDQIRDASEKMNSSLTLEERLNIVSASQKKEGK